MKGGPPSAWTKYMKMMYHVHVYSMLLFQYFFRTLSTLQTFNWNKWETRTSRLIMCLISSMLTLFQQFVDVFFSFYFDTQMLFVNSRPECKTPHPTDERCRSLRRWCLKFYIRKLLLINTDHYFIQIMFKYSVNFLIDLYCLNAIFFN